MTKPSSPPTEPGLDEVERAISLLDGRHPEHERTRRETIAAAEARRYDLDRELAAKARRRRRRLMVIGANVVALAVAGGVVWRLVGRMHAIRASLTQAEAPFVAAGLAEIASNEVNAKATVEADTPAESCFVAVAPGSTIHVRQGAMSLEGHESAGWCACSAGHASLEATGATGVALMRIEARAIGGPLARPWVSFAPNRWGDVDDDCNEASLDGWIAEHHAEAAPPGDPWLDANPTRAPLKRAGFRVLSHVASGEPFVAVSSAAGECMLAVASSGEALSLRVQGGGRPIVHAVHGMGWCDASPSDTTVWREGHGETTILAATGLRIGGLLGLRECAESAGLTLAPDALWLRDEDLGWNVTSLLRASTLTDVTTTALKSEPGSPSAGVTAFALSTKAKLASSPINAGGTCDPSFDAKAPEVGFVCTSARPITWWNAGDGPAFAAHASLPVWLSVLASRVEPEAIARILAMLALARRLAREGFAPTVLEGVEELQDGVRVVGRAGESAIVAIGLLPAPPWVVPYTDRVPWELGDEPTVVSLSPGTSVKLVAPHAAGVPLDKRRTVVFRRAAAH